MATLLLPKERVPQEVLEALNTLSKAGYEAYLVGGCVRDTLLGRTPKDWDITTNALPSDVIALYPKTVYENRFGTVTVILNAETNPFEVQITTYRTEHGYADSRHPDEVTFVGKLHDDLSRRDFTMNAIALSLTDKGQIEATIDDPYGGIKDIHKGQIKTVGNPDERFGEDALRILRAIRFACELSFEIDKDTLISITANSKAISNVSRERIRDEFIKIVMSPNPWPGLIVLRETGLLPHICPELDQAYGIEQNQAHAYDVFEHLGRSLQCAADKNWPLTTRLSALFHDIAKPMTREFNKEKGEYTFYGHEVVGSRETYRILENLKFPKDITKHVSKLVRWHMFFSDTEQITLSAVRRLIVNVGKENIEELMNLRVCDRIGTGRPKENPYRLRKFRAMIDEVMRDAVSVGMLAIDGNDLMEALHVKPGPQIGHVLNALTEKTLENPQLNTKDQLIKEAEELLKLPPAELEKLGKAGKDRIREEDEAIVKEIRSKHHVS